MKCTNPRTIAKPGYSDRAFQLLGRDDRAYQYDNMVVPCGKCMECTKARQNDIAFRIQSEAKERGSLAFITLTYNDSSLPLVSTLWRVDKSDGSCERLTAPEFVCYSRREDFWDYRKDFSEIKATSSARYIDVDVFEDSAYKYFTRITPSVCRKDVQNWLKRCRIHFERKLGRSLDFSYSICSEYGERFCRPHYHCCLMGVSKEDADIMASLWKFGFWKTDFVPVLNKDGSDAFSKVSAYVAKYSAKGPCRKDCEIDGTAFSCRQMNSKRLGACIEDNYRNYMLAVDMIGTKYNPDNFWCEDKRRYLTRPEISSLISEVPKRLAVNITGKVYYAIPRLIRKEVFYVKYKKDNATYYRPSKLWRMVVDSLQKLHADMDSREFGQFLALQSPAKIAEAVSTFNIQSENFAEYSESVGIQNYKNSLSKSVM